MNVNNFLLLSFIGENKRKIPIPIILIILKNNNCIKMSISLAYILEPELLLYLQQKLMDDF